MMSTQHATETLAAPAPAGADPLAHESALVLTAAFRSIDSFRRRIAVHHGISLNDVRALSRVAESEHATPKGIAESLELTTGSVTSLIDRLESAGLVSRTPHPHDRRSLQLELTDEGRRKMTDVYAAFEHRVAEALHSVPQEQVHAANDYLAAVTKAMNER